MNPFYIKNLCNTSIENLRKEGKIGSSQECRLVITISRLFVLDKNYIELYDPENIALVCGVACVDIDFDNSDPEDEPKVIAIPVIENNNWVKCPRCWKYHRFLDNYDALCDRCCEVLVELNHDSKSNILLFFRNQSEKYKKGCVV